MAKTDSKTCTQCGQEKTLSEFYKRKDRPCGYQSECKACNRQRSRRYRRENRDEISRRRRKHYQENADEIYRRALKYKLDNREKWAAHWTINNDIQNGHMPRAKELKCTRCDRQADDYHHYNGYSKKHRRDVIPLCRYCHQQEHSGVED